MPAIPVSVRPDWRHIMDMMSILKQSGAIGSIAQQLGVNEQVAQMGAEALLPSILGGFKKSAQAQPAGIEGLGGLLGQLGGGGLFDSVVSPEPTPVEQGNDILGQIFGTKDVSRTVAGHAAEQTGIDSGMLKKMLPILAMLVAGYMAKQAGGGGRRRRRRCWADCWAAYWAADKLLAAAALAACSAMFWAERLAVVKRRPLRVAAALAVLDRCSTWMATAIRWTTLSAWPER